MNAFIITTIIVIIIITYTFENCFLSKSTRTVGLYNKLQGKFDGACILSLSSE